MQSPASRRIPSLDGLRAFSIILVIIGHSIQRSHNGWSVILGFFGVQIFFVLSGYLITGLLQDEYERDGRISLSSFYKRRCFRIFPAAFAYILLIAYLVPSTRYGLPYALTYTVSYRLSDIPVLFYHLWSLSVEEQFYLLWPLALVLGYRFRGLIAIMAMVAAALFRLAMPSTSPSVHYSFCGAMDSIAAGCLLAIYKARLERHVIVLSQSATIAVALPTVAFLLACFCWATPLPALFGVVPLLLAFWTAILIKRRDRILNSRAAVTIGVLSYSLYLWQQAFMFGCPWPLLPSLAALSLCAVGSYIVIERPMIAIGRSITSQLQTSIPAPERQS